MQSENKIVQDLPAISLDDTPTPLEVIEAVDALQANGKQVNVKISRADYTKLMQMPHEARLKYAIKVMEEREQQAIAKPGIDRRLAEQRKRRRAASKRQRQQRRKSRG